MAQGGSYGAMRAVNELRAIFASQWRDGMLPHIRFAPGAQGYRPDARDWGVPAEASGGTALPTSGVTQPPIVGLCAWEVFRKLSPHERQRYLADFTQIARRLEKYHAWLLRERDPWGENLALCLHPWETGTDNSPAFEPLMEATRAYLASNHVGISSFGRADAVHVAPEQRPTDRDYAAYFGLVSLFRQHGYRQRELVEACPFLLQDVLFNSVLCASLRALSSLQSALADLHVEEVELQTRSASNWERAQLVSEAIRSKLWHAADGFFYSYDARAGRLLETPTVSGFAPLLAGIADAAQAARLVQSLLDPAMFGSVVLVPSTALSSPHFDARRYWSGPSWPVTNWLIVRGLKERGHPVWRELCASTLRMIAGESQRSIARQAASEVMERHSVGEEFTVPSRKQYAHAWLWDSAIAALSWPSVRERPTLDASPVSAPPFAEYFHPQTGVPLGAAPMTWTASLYIELEAMLIDGEWARG